MNIRLLFLYAVTDLLDMYGSDGSDDGEAVFRSLRPLMN